jgi:HD-GYP domain-containing protein (c-di-GMP phosphodiesterase class II)
VIQGALTVTVLRSHFPIHTLDRRELLPSGTRLTRKTLDDLSRSGARETYPAIPLLKYGTVRRDLLKFLRKGAYGRIFDNSQRNASLMALMEKVLLPLPVLEALHYFQRSDPYTYRHVLRVFALAILLAGDLEAKYEELILEAAAGPLHDFGKICVPLRILKKTTPLRRTERALLEHHTTAGFVLIGYYMKESKNTAAKVAAEHHERKDGSGYPLGITLNDRLVEIVVACDVYDALISPRPYRRDSYDNRTALEEITEMANRGKIGWEVVKALVAHNRKDRPRAEECAVSVEKRGKPPEGNLYGILLDDNEPPDALPR